jgi:hypothetical protein
MSKVSQPLEKLEQISLEFELATKTSTVQEMKAEVDEKLNAMQDAKKQLARLLMEAEKYKERGVLLPAPWTLRVFQGSLVCPT